METQSVFLKHPRFRSTVLGMAEGVWLNLFKELTQAKSRVASCHHGEQMEESPPGSVGIDFIKLELKILSVHYLVLHMLNSTERQVCDRVSWSASVLISESMKPTYILSLCHGSLQLNLVSSCAKLTSPGGAWCNSFLVHVNCSLVPVFIFFLALLLYIYIYILTVQTGTFL